MSKQRHAPFFFQTLELWLSKPLSPVQIYNKGIIQQGKWSCSTRWNLKGDSGKRQSSVRLSSILGPPDFLACLYRCVWCSVSLTRGIPGLRRGLWKMRFSCFATKALLHVTEETHPNGGGLGWIIQHLQSISALPPPLPPTSQHLPGPQSLQAHHGNVDNSLCDVRSGPVATWEVVAAWIFVSLQLSKANCWIIKLSASYFILDWLWCENQLIGLKKTRENKNWL